jgi:peptide/nickel transport system ATP-binding protein/oligopeptide transport system ATP-binding protein
MLQTHFYTTRGTIKAVDGVDLKIGRGKAVGLVGESGSGKSTLAFSIVRLVRNPGKISAGKIWFDETDLLTLTKEEMRKIRGKCVSMIFQDPTTYLSPTIKVWEQIADGMIIHQKMDKKVARSVAIELLRTVLISEPEKVVDYYPHQLSGGMCQRVLIASAVCCNPALLIADEPTTALDVTVQAQILELVKQLRKEKGLALLLITHDLGIVAELCEIVYVMYAGKIVEYGDVYTLYKNARHPYTIGLLDCVLSIDNFKKTLTTIDGTVPDLLSLPTGCRFHPRCRYAKSICRKDEPPPFTVEKDHVVFCWLER